MENKNFLKRYWVTLFFITTTVVLSITVWVFNNKINALQTEAAKQEESMVATQNNLTDLYNRNEALQRALQDCFNKQQQGKLHKP